MIRQKKAEALAVSKTRLAGMQVYGNKVMQFWGKEWLNLNQCNCIDFSCFHDSFTSYGYGHASLCFDQLHSRLGELGVGFAHQSSAVSYLGELCLLSATTSSRIGIKQWMDVVLQRVHIAYISACIYLDQTRVEQLNGVEWEFITINEIIYQRWECLCMVRIGVLRV